MAAARAKEATMAAREYSAKEEEPKEEVARLTTRRRSLPSGCWTWMWLRYQRRMCNCQHSLDSSPQLLRWRTTRRNRSGLSRTTSPGC